MASSTGIYKYPLPTVDFAHCQVLHTELVDVMEGFLRRPEAALFQQGCS